MRVFYGVVFNEEIKKKISDIQQEIMKISNSGKFVSTENFHLTLKFIGEIGTDQVKEYGNLIFEGIRDVEKFVMRTNGIGFFSRGSKQLPWIGISKENQLIDLQKRVQEALSKRMDNKVEAFTPHITLGRDVELSSQLDGIKIDDFDIVVNRIALFESKNMDGKLTYLERAVVHLL